MKLKIPGIIKRAYIIFIMVFIAGISSSCQHIIQLPQPVEIEQGTNKAEMLNTLDEITDKVSEGDSLNILFVAGPEAEAAKNTIEEFEDDVGDDISHHLEVLPTKDLKENTHNMIINEGGLGGAIYIMVGMGFFVALIILSVTMYQSIQEKIPVFGTLKAIGASKGYINKMLLGQVFAYMIMKKILSR